MSACEDRLDRLRQRVRLLRGEPHAPWQAVGGRDRALAADLDAVLELRVQDDVVERRGQHPAADLEDVRGLLYGALEVAGHFGERGDEQVAEAVPLEAAVGEAVLEQAAHERLVVGERDEAVADVAGGRHPQVAPQAAGAAAVVGHRDHGGDVAGVLLQAAEQGGEAVAAADRGDARTLGETAGQADLARRLGVRPPPDPGVMDTDRERDAPGDEAVEGEHHRRVVAAGEPPEPDPAQAGRPTRSHRRRRSATRGATTAPATASASQRLSPMPG